ncbi:MAG: DUF3795 domain-containing protein [Myxococcota bacterium]|jgi:hypothetical protein|nr:DUF3795 domain-containing protein [Myxococcota bacterium]
MNPQPAISPCGIDCFNCEVYEDKLSDELRARLAATFGLEPEKVACKGCREQNGCRLHWGACATLDCVKAHQVDYCYECNEFPCEKLCPSRESAERYPHNLKLYNLCRMKLLGLEAWAQEAATNRRRYFRGTFVVGTGAVLDASKPTD